jgi:hypothetical protein
MYSYKNLLILLTLEYFTEEQIRYLSLKLNDSEYHSFYMHSVMHEDIKLINQKRENKIV